MISVQSYLLQGFLDVWHLRKKHFSDNFQLLLAEPSILERVMSMIFPSYTILKYRSVTFTTYCKIIVENKIDYWLTSYIRVMASPVKVTGVIK